MLAMMLVAATLSSLASGSKSAGAPRWYIVLLVYPLGSTQEGYLHINTLEFLVLILEFAAVIQWWRDATDTDIQRVFPEGRPVCALR
jgi:hypothetical protein